MPTQPHILIAEDDPDTRELIELALMQEGFRVSATGDSSEVLPLLASDRFDVLLLETRCLKLLAWNSAGRFDPSINTLRFSFVPA